MGSARFGTVRGLSPSAPRSGELRPAELRPAELRSAELRVAEHGWAAGGRHQQGAAKKNEQIRNSSRLNRFSLSSDWSMGNVMLFEVQLLACIRTTLATCGRRRTIEGPVTGTARSLLIVGTWDANAQRRQGDRREAIDRVAKKQVAIAS